MSYGVRLITTTTAAVDQRLRLLALITRQPLSRVLTTALDQALPPVDELVGQLQEQEAAAS